MDAENGPTRRVARSRKRSSSCIIDSSNIVNSSKKQRDVQRQSEPKQTDLNMAKEEWFRNSFCRDKIISVSTADTSPNDSGVLDTSDALLADLDIDTSTTVKPASNDTVDTFQVEANQKKDSGKTSHPKANVPTGQSNVNNSQIFGELGEEDLFTDDWDDTGSHTELSQRVDSILSIFDSDSQSSVKHSFKISQSIQPVTCGLQNGDNANIETKRPSKNRTTSAVTNPHHYDTKLETNRQSTNIDTSLVNNIQIDNKTASGSNEPKSMSIKDRLKQKMKRNSLVPTAISISNTVEELRQTVVRQAEKEALALQQQGTDVDIGPFYGLPSKVQKLLETQRGITKFYDWQDECLRLPAVLEGRNLIYSLPTSGGKTLVAEILILRELLCKKRDAILILPYVSIVQEKVRNMCQFALDLDFLVEEYAGSKGRFPPIKRRRKRTLYIATLEKAHSLVNSLIETQNLESLGLAVVDELHMIGEGGSRGATLEAALLKLLHYGGTQIIGMSATLNNIGDLQKFLHAEIYSNNFRPVKLTEYVKVEDSVFVVENSRKQEEILQHDRVIMFPYSEELRKQDPDHLLGLVLEVVPGNSCLVFCHTKKNCENVARMLAKFMLKYHKHLTCVKRAERKQLLQELYKDGNGQICPVLEYTVHLGIAYHHSGLTTDERRLIEDAYSDGTLCLLTCTSTLAAGVNLPAKRVILRSPYVGSAFISHSQYKQMTGRAGRAGIDDSGESILICKKADAGLVRELLTRSQEPCHSSLMYDSGKGVRTMLLSSIGLKILKSSSDMMSYMRNTLLSVQSDQLGHDVDTLTRESLKLLLQLRLVQPARKVSSSQSGSQKLKTPETQRNNVIHSHNHGTSQSNPVSNDRTGSQGSEVDTVEWAQSQLTGEKGTQPVDLEVSALGRATFKGSIDLDYSRVLYEDLKRAEESLVLASYLHLLYLVTPYDMARDLNIPWMVYFQQMSNLSPLELRVATLIGVPESYIAKRASGQSSRQKVNETVVSRFYLTLMLYELWQQKTVWQVAARFQTGRGFVQNLLTAAASFASSVFHFCQELDEFWGFQELLGNFVKRLSYCVTMELIPLMEIPGVKLGRARQLYQSGMKSVQDVASCDLEKLVKSIEHLPRKAARQIVASAKLMVNEKAEALWEEVESLVGLPLS